MSCYKVFAVLVALLTVNSCTSVQYSNSLDSSKNKIAILYNHKDQGSLELINYIFCYEKAALLDAKFSTHEISQDGTGLQNKLTELTLGGYQVIISLLRGETAKMLDQDISKMDFALFSPTQNDFKYKAFISDENLPINNQTLYNVDIIYQSSSTLPLPQNSVKMFKILSLIKALTDRGHHLSFRAFKKLIGGKFN